jgi:hypothetical protein
LSDDHAGRFGAAETVSVRAVLDTGDGADINALLMQAGIFDPVSVPVVFGDEPSVSEGLLGDGATDNLAGVLEWDDAGDGGSASPGQDGSGPAKRAGTSAPGWVTRTLPAAFGIRPLAPVRVREAGALGTAPAPSGYSSPSVRPG